MTSSDVDSSSEEDLEKFKESVDQHFLTDELYSENPRKISKERDEIPKSPSLRRNINEEDEALNLFHVTPEFQKYVAKHLSAKLEDDLRQREVTISTSTNHTQQRRKGGIKLLHSSLHRLKVPKLSDEHVEQHNSIVSKKMVNFDEDALEAQCKLVAVDGEHLLSRADVKCWSNRSKAEVFCYKRGKKGVLEYQAKSFVPITYK